MCLIFQRLFTGTFTCFYKQLRNFLLYCFYIECTTALIFKYYFKFFSCQFNFFRLYLWMFLFPFIYFFLLLVHIFEHSIGFFCCSDCTAFFKCSSFFTSLFFFIFGRRCFIFKLRIYPASSCF